VPFIIVLQKYDALKIEKEFSDAMIAYIRAYVLEKLSFKPSKLKESTQLVLKIV